MRNVEQNEPAPRDLDLEHPSIARVYDYYLGGEANWAIDRELGNRILASYPLLQHIAVANRLFLHRAVRHLVRLGIRQFIDIGAGVPTMGNTHQIAARAADDSRVVYIDNEPVAVAHSNLLLRQEGAPEHHAVLNADLRSPDRLWRQVEEVGVLDLSKPLAVLIVAVLHVQQPGPDGADVGPASVARYRELMPSRSYLAVSHITDEGVPGKLENDLAEIKRMYDESGSPVIWRSQDEIRSFLGNFVLVEPGMTWTPLWHPEEAADDARKVEFTTPNESAIWAGIGRKP